MKFSIRFNSDTGDVAHVVRLARAAEEAGFEIVWYCQDLLRRDAWIVLTAIAAATSHIRVGTAIVNPYSSDPAEIAMRAATLQEFSGGRFLLGIGPGEPAFLRWIGREAAKPRTGVAEAIAILRRLLAGEAAPSDGAVFRWTSDARLQMPAPRVPVPIYVGGQGPRTLELIGEAADGGLPILFPPEYLGAVSSRIAAGAARAGRDPLSIDVAGCIWYCIAADDAAAKDTLRPLIAYYGPVLNQGVLGAVGLSPGDFDGVREAWKRGPEAAYAAVTDKMLRLAIVGDPPRIVERLRTLAASGLRHVNVGPPLGPDPIEAIRLTGRAIIPALRDV